MRVKAFLTVAGILGIAFGIAFLVAAPTMQQLYGIAAEPSNVMQARAFGATLLPWGLVAWFLRDSQDPGTLRAVLMGSAVGFALGAVLTVHAITQGLVNALGWSTVGIYVLLLAGAVYFLASPRAIRA